MNKELISIIVPVFNVEKYLQECIDSILKQTYGYFEIILVDDGSTDGSINIAETYARKDSRIKLIKQKKSGAGAARNKGMAIAKGKYLLFLDSDDFFAPQMLEKLLCLAEKNDAQVVEFGHYEYDDQTKKLHIPQKKFAKRKLVSSIELGKEIFTMCMAVPWSKLLLRSFVVESNILYQNISCNNDVLFNRMIVLLADKIVLSDERFVFHRNNNSSSIQGNSNRNLMCIAHAFSALKSEMEKRNLFHGNFKEAYGNELYKVFGFYIVEYGSNYSRRELYEYIKHDAIPALFDSEADIRKNERLSRIIDSQTYEDFLVSEIQYQKRACENRISKDSKDYLLGNLLLRIPRKIKEFYRSKI